MINRKWIRHLGKPSNWWAISTNTTGFVRKVPEELPAGSVRLIVLFPDEDDAGNVWANGIAREWSAELSDPKQDIYTLDDGQPVNAPR